MGHSQPTTYHFQGILHVPAGQPFICQYIQEPFEVPQGMGEMRLALRYEPARVAGVANLITLGLFDPRGFRGNAHRSPPDEQVVITPEQATPGFIPGALPPGKWLAQLAAHVILADSVDCQYSLDIEMIAMPAEQPPSEIPAGPAPAAPSLLRGGPQWYRGELHSHTVHSDGSHTPAELLEFARTRGLDFLTITDHNTHSVFKALEQVDTQGLLVIPGIELTSFHGHALLLGVDAWVDWRAGYAGWRMEDAARQVHAAGGLFILAHPKDIGSPFCTGCRWEYDDFDLSLADGVEIWNELWSSGGNKNPGGLELWQQAQAAPRRFLATAGTDFHAERDWGPGSPSVYVYARELSAPAVLEAVRAGRLILTSGPWINLSLVSPLGELCRVGDSCSAAEGNPLQLDIEWADVPAHAHLLLRSGQDVLDALPISGKGTVRQPVSIQADQRFWIELYAADGQLLALTNPLYITRQT